MPQKFAFLGLLLAISLTIKFSMAGLNMLIVSPLLFYSHHQFDMDMARLITREKKHKVHVFVPVREKEECTKVNESVQEANFTMECYYKESTKKHWAEKNGKITGFPDFYNELYTNLEWMDKMRSQKFDIGIAQLHFFSRPALELYSKLGIKKHIGMLATSLSPINLKLVGLMDQAIEHSVPPVDYGKTNTKIGDSQQMSEERKNFIKQVYEKSTSIEIDPLTKGLSALFINSRKEFEWNNGEWMANPSMKLAFICGFNLPKNMRKNDKDAQNIELDEKQQKTGNKTKVEKTVLLSLGTLVDTTKKVTDKQIYSILWALQRFPQFKFIWKVSENEKRLNLLRPVKYSKHIKIVKWFDQRQKLAEPNTVGFISHCGRNSELESIVNRVPLICVPFSGDQFYNAEALAQKGASISIDIRNKFSREIMANQLEKLLGQPKGNLRKRDEMQRAKEEMVIKKAHQNLLKNFDILHKSMNHDIEKDEMGKEIFGILDEIEKQLAQNPSD